MMKLTRHLYLVDRRSALLRLLRAQSVQSPAGRNPARDRPYRLLPLHGARCVEGASRRQGRSGAVRARRSKEYSKLKQHLLPRRPAAFGEPVHRLGLDDPKAPSGCGRTRDFRDEPRTLFTITKAPSIGWTLRLRFLRGPPPRRSGQLAVPGSTPGAGSYPQHRSRMEEGRPRRPGASHEPGSRAFPDKPRVQAFLYDPFVLAGDLGAQGSRTSWSPRPAGTAVGKIPINVPELHAREEASRLDQAGWLCATRVPRRGSESGVTLNR